MVAGLLLVFASIFATSYSAIEDLDLGKIVFTNILYRHGDRTPIATYPTDPYRNESSWPAAYGELTNLGKHQQLLLGRWLRKRYSDLLPATYTRYDIYVRSTDVDRTLMSAEANLAGLYPPMNNQIWDRIKWMPIPIHTIPEDQDYVLSGKKYCARYKYELDKVLTSPERKRINKANAELYKYLSNNSGYKVSSIEDVEHLYNILYIENLYNKTLPKWTESVFPDKMKPFAELSFTTEAYNKILQRLKSGPLLGEMIDHMVKKSQNTLKPDRKAWIYSAHDQTVANLLMTLNLFELHCPPYAATVLIELRINFKNQYFVTVSYKNSSKEPTIMTLPGCTTLCPLENFITLTKDVVPDDWKRECLFDAEKYAEKYEYNFNTAVAITILTLSILLVLVVVILAIGCMYWRDRKEHKQYYLRLTTDAI